MNISKTLWFTLNSCIVFVVFMWTQSLTLLSAHELHLYLYYILFSHHPSLWTSLHFHLHVPPTIPTPLSFSVVSHLLFLQLLWVLLWRKPYYDASYPIVSGWSGEGEECKHERVTKTVSMTTTSDSLPSFLESQSIPNVLSDYPITVNLSWLLLASFPGFPFLVLLFAFRIKKRRNTEKWGRPGNTYMYYMNDIRCWWGWRRGGEGVHIQQHIRHHHQALCC